MDEKEIQDAIAKYKFYHNIKLTDKITTPGWAAMVPAQNLFIRHLESLDLKGKRVLDIGCRDGLFSFKAESMGAQEVVGIDNDVSKPATEFIIPLLHSQVKMLQLNLYDLDPTLLGFFDTVIFAGVLYHLRYPFWGLKMIRDVMKVGGSLLIETAIWRGEPDKAMLFCPVGNEGPYYPDMTSCTFFNEKGLVDTMKSLGFETMQVEYLRSPLRSSFKQEMKQMTKNVLCFLFTVAPTSVENISGLARLKKRVTQSSKLTERCVFQLVYRGYDPNSDVVVSGLPDGWARTVADVQSNTKNYWEKTHDMHTKHG